MGDNTDNDIVDGFEEIEMPPGEWRGWIRNRTNHELEWCIVTAGLMGVFNDPEAAQARIVINLGDYDAKPLCEDLGPDLEQGTKRGSTPGFAYLDDVYSVKFVSKRNTQVVYTFGAETEDDFRTWYRAITGKEIPAILPSSSITGPSTESSTPNGHHAAASRTDSGLGDDLSSSGSFSGRCESVGSGYKTNFDSIEEAEFINSDLDSSQDTNAHGGVVGTFSTGEYRKASPDKCEKSLGSRDITVCDSLRDAGHSDQTTPDSATLESAEPRTEITADEASTAAPLNRLRLRPNSHNIRAIRADNSIASAPVGDFAFWEEGVGEVVDDTQQQIQQQVVPQSMLTKTYSLPMRSPVRKRGASEGDSVNTLSKNTSRSEETIAEEVPTSTTMSKTPPHRESPTKGRSAYIDPVRKSNRAIGSRMSVKASKLVGRMTPFRSQKGKSPLARSALTSPTIEGDLLRKQKNTIVPCFCVLSGTVLYTYKSQKSDDVSDLTIDVAKFRLSKLAAAKTLDKELDCAFVLTSHTSAKEHVFIAKDLTLARRWYGHLQDILKALEARQIRAMHSSAPDLATGTSVSPSFPSASSSMTTLNHSGKFSPTFAAPGKYMKTKTSRGSTFKRMAAAEEEKRSSIAARMSRGSFLELYGHSEDTISERRGSLDYHIGKDDDDDNGHGADDEDDAFIEITDDEIHRAKSGLGDRVVSRSMDDIGLTPSSRHQLLAGKPLALGRTAPSLKTTHKTKRQKRTVPIPASEVANPVKSGYVEIKKSGSWKRCWTLLTDDRLYLYRKPTDPHTLDMVLLEGYLVQSSVLSANSSKHGSRFAFELYHSHFSETQLACESLEERSVWMAAISESCKKCTSPGRKTSPVQLGSNEKIFSPARSDSEHGDSHSQLSDGNKAYGSSSDGSDESPILGRRKQFIEDKYERVKEAQEMETLRENTILNQRRMSADVKINAVEKQLQQQRSKHKKRKKNVSVTKDEEGAFLEEELEQLRSRLHEVEKESQETSLKQEERRRAIENKKDVEVKILEQERKLQKHRKAAQQALQQIVKDISLITPPPAVGGSGRPRFDLIAEEAEEGESEERKMSVASSFGVSSSDSMGSLCEHNGKRLSTSETSIPENSATSPTTPTSPHHESSHSTTTSQLIMPTRRSAVSGAPLSLAAARRKAANLGGGESAENLQRKAAKLSSDFASNNSTSSSNSSSPSGADSPDLPRHSINLVDELEEYFPSSSPTDIKHFADSANDVEAYDDVDGDYGTRDKSKSFDSGIADEVDMNSNKASMVIHSANGHYDDEKQACRVKGGAFGGANMNHIRTEVGEDVLRDIEEFENIARLALEQASWMV